MLISSPVKSWRWSEFLSQHTSVSNERVLQSTLFYFLPGFINFKQKKKKRRKNLEVNRSGDKMALMNYFAGVSCKSSCMSASLGRVACCPETAKKRNGYNADRKQLISHLSWMFTMSDFMTSNLFPSNILHIDSDSQNPKPPEVNIETFAVSIIFLRWWSSKCFMETRLVWR